MTTTKRTSTAHRTTIVGLVLAAAGIAILYVSGVEMPVVPPGFVLLLLAAALMAFTRWRWTPFAAIAIAVFEAIPLAVGIVGGDTAENLVDFAHLGVLAGTWVRLIGAVVALVAGLVAAAVAYRREAAVAA